MDQHGSVCGYAVDESKLHQINDHGCEARFDHVSTDAPDNRLLQLARTTNSFRKLAKRPHRKHIRKCVEKLTERRIITAWLRKLIQIDFARPRRKRVGFD